MSFRRSEGAGAGFLLLALLLALGVAFGLRAFEQFNIHIGQLSGSAWQAQDLDFQLAWPELRQSRFHLTIGRLRLPGLRQTLQGLGLECVEGEIGDQTIRCRRGHLRLPLAQLDRPEAALSFDLQRPSGRLQGRLSGLALAGGRIDVDFTLDGDSWRFRLDGKHIALGVLRKRLNGFLPNLPEWGYSGRFDAVVDASGRQRRPQRLSWQIQFSGLGFSDDAGNNAAEGLGGSSSGRLRRSGDRWRLAGKLGLERGELLTPYLYLDAGAHPLQLKLRGEAPGDLTRFELKHGDLSLGRLLSLQLAAEVAPAASRPLRALHLRMPAVKLAPIYGELLQPVLSGTPWDHFELAGRLGGGFDLSGSTLGLDLDLQGVSIDDAEGSGERRVGLYDLDGEVHWRHGEIPADSRLSWRAGHLLEKIDLGPGRIDFRLADQRFQLLRQARLPVLDGALVIDRLDLDALGEGDQRLRFDGMITPISMRSLSAALGWMPLSGKLSGMIPGLSYKQGLLKVDGVLLVHIFDGDILISGLELRDLFGVYPQLSANLKLKNLDLETLTRTFSFGRITGRLDGYVKGLRLEAWRPVAFDARFYTPPGDKSRHRISQKAVDNISNLGGAGLSGSLARSFLRFFDEFSYRRIGIGCRLSQGRCAMSGVGKAKQGYYLVQGGGIPRIDIIGFNRSADWDGLVQQLKQITESGAPVVE